VSRELSEQRDVTVQQQSARLLMPRRLQVYASHTFLTSLSRQHVRKSVPTSQVGAAIRTHQTPQLAAYSYHICHRTAHVKLYKCKRIVKSYR